MNCVECGNEIVGAHGNVKYCSSACRTKVKVKAKVEGRYKRDRVKSITYCVACGIEMVVAHRNTKYCSYKCKHGVDEPAPTIKCAECGIEMDRDNGNRKYCSNTCKGRAKRKSAAYIAKLPALRERKRAPAREYAAKRRIECRELLNARSNEWKKANRDKCNLQHKKDRARKKGMTLDEYLQKRNPNLWIANPKRLQKICEINAAQAWDYWINIKAPNEWIEAYYANEPWKNKRLSIADRYKIRYKNDEVFRRKEIDRFCRRKELIFIKDDKTVDYAVLINERKTCLYCGTSLNERNRVVDHMDPLAFGGLHSMSNLVCCCNECNKKKAGKSFDVWLSFLSEKHRKVASRIYMQKHGCQPGQASLQFEFAT